MLILVAIQTPFISIFGLDKYEIDILSRSLYCVINKVGYD